LLTFNIPIPNRVNIANSIICGSSIWTKGRAISLISSVALNKYISSTITKERNPRVIKNIRVLPVLLYARKEIEVKKIATIRLAICNII